MPLYEYECPNHGKFEVVKSFKDKSVERCPLCKSKAKKLISIFAIKWRETSMGKTRDELFDNLAKEGNGGRYWRDYDTYYHRATGNEDALNAQTPA